MNVYDSARMLAALKMQGYDETTKPIEADIILLNTCHIREKAADKLYSEVGRLNAIKQKRAEEGKSTLIIVAGCVVQATGSELLSRMHGVDIAVGPQNYHLLPELVAKYDRKKGRVLVADFPAESKFDYLPQHDAKGPTAFVAIQEGCDKFCSYCVVVILLTHPLASPFYILPFSVFFLDLPSTDFCARGTATEREAQSSCHLHSQKAVS